MAAFFEFIGELFGSFLHWFSTNAWTTGKAKLIFLGCGIALGAIAMSHLKDSNASKNRLHFQVDQEVQIPGGKYEPITSPEVKLEKLGSEGNLNVLYNFSYSYLDSNKRNSKATIIVTCPTELLPTFLSANQAAFLREEKESEITSIYFEVTPIAEKTSGFIELQLQIKSAKRFDIKITGMGYDKPLFFYDKEGYSAGTATYNFTSKSANGENQN